MTNDERLRLQRAADYLQQSAALLDILERTLSTNIDDVRALRQSVRLAADAIRPTASGVNR